MGTCDLCVRWHGLRGLTRMLQAELAASAELEPVASSAGIAAVQRSEFFSQGIGEPRPPAGALVMNLGGVEPLASAEPAMVPVTNASAESVLFNFHQQHAQLNEDAITDGASQGTAPNTAGIRRVQPLLASGMCTEVNACGAHDTSENDPAPHPPTVGEEPHSERLDPSIEQGGAGAGNRECPSPALKFQVPQPSSGGNDVDHISEHSQVCEQQCVHVLVSADESVHSIRSRFQRRVFLPICKERPMMVQPVCSPSATCVWSLACPCPPLFRFLHSCNPHLAPVLTYCFAVTVCR